MSRNIEKYLESLYSSFCKTLSDDEEGKSIINDVKPNYIKLMSDLNPEAIKYCMENYLETELDTNTPGNRGIGRMAENIPRFGALFRNQLTKLYDQERDELYSLMENLFLIGYFHSGLLIVWPAKSDKISKKDQLFNVWIPIIYSVNPYEFDPDVWQIIRTNGLDTIIMIQDFLRKYGMENDSLFRKAGRALSGDKINVILEYYLVAGFTLRATEEGYY